jgi:hypothetical protein
LNNQYFNDFLKTFVSSIKARSPGSSFHSFAEDTEKLHMKISPLIKRGGGPTGTRARLFGEEPGA